ncbi:uncharacterized protein LOC135839383 [Planococcus citri]|uniref:uncharacterized protein LOC135839383 n=1 Tax=Planococcus citri TaxID=170843 RepID=UPI0031FA46E8
MYVKLILCDDCHGPLMEPGPHSTGKEDPAHVTVCTHVYHWACIHHLFLQAPNIEHVTCKHPGCQRKLSRFEFVKLDAPTRIQTFQPPPDTEGMTALQKTLSEHQQGILIQKELIKKLQQKNLLLSEELKANVSAHESTKNELKELESRYNLFMDQKLNQYLESSTNSTPSLSPIASNSKIPPLMELETSSFFGSVEFDLTRESSRGQMNVDQSAIESMDVVIAPATNTPIIEYSSPLHQNQIYPAPAYQHEAFRPYAGIRRGVSERRIYPTFHNVPEPQPEKKNLTAECPRYHKKYLARFGTSSAELSPFYPINAYPFHFTAAGRKDPNGDIHVVFFMNKALMIGDGHVYAMAECMADEKPFKKYVDWCAYRRDFLASDLLLALEQLLQLPKKLMISIGNFDVVCKTTYSDFCDQMMKIARLLKGRKVEELFILPLLKVSSQYQSAFDQINMGLQHDWGMIAGGKTTRLDEYFKCLDAIPTARDEFGPYHNVKRYETILDKVAEIYIPLPVKLQAKLKRGITLQPPSKDRRRIEALRAKEALDKKRTMSVQPSVKDEEMNVNENPSTAETFTPEQKAEIDRIKKRNEEIERRVVEKVKQGNTDDRHLRASIISEIALEEANKPEINLGAKRQKIFDEHAQS